MAGHCDCGTKLWPLAALKDKIREVVDQPTSSSLDGSGRRARSFGSATIFTVSNYLSEVQPTAYVPSILVMGPYHSKRESSEIAECKITSAAERGTKFFDLQKHILDNISDYMNMYDRKLEISPESLSIMLALDASLLSDLLDEYEKRDYPLQTKLFSSFVLPRRHFWPILRDVVLMENQIPIKLLSKAMDEGRLQRTAHKLITNIYPFRTQGPEQVLKKTTKVEDCHHLLDYLYKNCTHKVECDEKADRSDVQIPGATQLRAAGIHFKTTEEGDLNSIKFDTSTSTLHLPIVKMYSESETWFRNLMAYEQCRNNLSVHWCSYMRLMASLIDTPEDVKLMMEKKVLVNLMGSNEAVANVWNKLGVNVELFLTKRDKDIMETINKHCSSTWKVWLAETHDLYFSQPWSCCKVGAACLAIAIGIVGVSLTIKKTLF